MLADKIVIDVHYMLSIVGPTPKELIKKDLAE